MRVSVSNLPKCRQVVVLYPSEHLTTSGPRRGGQATVQASAAYPRTGARIRTLRDSSFSSCNPLEISEADNDQYALIAASYHHGLSGTSTSSTSSTVSTPL